MGKIHIFDTIYVGYYGDYILAASNDKKELKTYLKDIRGLLKGEYEIREITLDEMTIHSLYDEFLIDIWNEIPLTQRDIEALEDDIRAEFRGISTIFNDISYLNELFKTDRKLKKATPHVSEAIDEIYGVLTSQKLVTRLRDSLAQMSPIMSSDITEYLARMGAIKEEKELRELFLNKVFEDD